MNSRQTQRTIPGRGSVLQVSFPALFSRSSSPPLITNRKTTPNITNQFVRLSSPHSKLMAPQHGKSSSKILRENNFLLNSDAYKIFPFSGNKKSLSALDLRAAQKIDSNKNNCWPRRNNVHSKLANSGGIENIANVRSTPTSANFEGNKNTCAHGSILKKSENQNEDFGFHLNEEFLASMKSKRKVLFKNKVSVFRFDSDGDSALSSSDFDRVAKNQTTQNRRYRTMASKGTFISPKNSLPPPSPSLKTPSPFQRHMIIPPKPKPKSSIRNESVYLLLGDEGTEHEVATDNRRLTIPPTTSTTIDSNNYYAPPQQHEYESILYKTPSGDFVINGGSSQDGDSLSNSVASSKSSSRETSGSKDSKSSKHFNDENNASNSNASSIANNHNNNNNPEKHPKKDSMFAYHVTNDSNKLVVSVKLGVRLHPNDVLVKANKNGTKLRIVTNPDAISTLKLNEQIMLPIHVNPYQLSAKIDQSGNLLIEAPISK